MHTAIELVLRGIFIGAGATLLIDLWAALLRRFGVPSLNFGLLGRWIGHLPEGRFIHESIAKAAPVPARVPDRLARALRHRSQLRRPASGDVWP